jgi:hypothetical protein
MSSYAEKLGRVLFVPFHIPPIAFLPFCGTIRTPHRPAAAHTHGTGNPKYFYFFSKLFLFHTEI